MKLEVPPGWNSPQDGGGDARQTLLLLGVSVLALPAGILAAWRYRRRKTVKSA